MRYPAFALIALLLAALTVTLAPTAAQDEDPGVLNIYSSRHYGAMEAPFVAFEEATGIEVRVSAGTPRDLYNRLAADIGRGGRSVADLFLAIDAGVLGLAVDNGLLQPLSEADFPELYANVPEAYRDPAGHWFGLSIRARTAVYNPENVSEAELETLTTYADLADPTWEGRLCMRPASHIYTVSVFSSLIYHLGPEAAEEASAGIANNVARYINSDTSQIRAVAAGECDVALVNHYYMGQLGSSEDPADQAVFESVAIQWLNQGEDQPGVFFNVNGAGVVTGARNYDNAVAFIQFMSELEMQGASTDAFSGSNYEYPTNPQAELMPILESFGEVRFDTTYPLWEYGDLQSQAVEMLEAVSFGFNEN